MDQQARLEAIQRKEEELRLREKALKDQEIDMGDTNPPNFPPMLKLVYHNISEEIPIAHQSTVKMAFIFSLCCYVTLCLNALSCCFIGTMGSSGSSGTTYSVGTYIVFGLLFAILGIPLHFNIIYYRFYTQVKEERLGLAWFGLQGVFLLITAYACVGTVNSGFVGLITMLDMLAKSSNTFAIVISMITGICWCLCAVGQLTLFTRGMKIYQSMGGQIPKMPSSI